jgi:hypothetical protein
MGEIVDYDDFTLLTPTSSNKVVGGVCTDNYVYCRPCIDRFGKDWNTMKPITNRKSKEHIYNCCICGWRVSQKRVNSI